GGGPGTGAPGGGGGARPRPAQPSFRNVYVLATNAPSGSADPVLKPEAVRIKTGIGDGAFTEVTDGLKEGETVVTGVKLPQGQAPAVAPGGTSPFGGGGGRRGF